MFLTLFHAQIEISPILALKIFNPANYITLHFKLKFSLSLGQILILLTMARYDKNEIFERAKTAIVEEDLLTLTDVVAFLPCGKSTFYEMFAGGSDELESLKELLECNKIKIKQTLRRKWAVSDNATLQLALYKLSANDEEHRKLSQQYIEQESRNINTDVDLEEFERIRESIKLK